MKLRLRYTGSLVLLFVAMGVNGQSDSTRRSFSIDLTVDYGKLATLLMDHQTRYEGEVGLMYGRYRITGEYGYSEIDSDKLYDNTVIKASGTYYRAGFDFKIPINPKNNLFIGARYGTSEFDESLTVSYNSTVFDPFVQETNGLTANWYEAVISSETKIIAQLFLGFKARIRFLDKYDNPGLIDIIEIPGYGKAFDKSVLAVNLHLRYYFILR